MLAVTDEMKWQLVVCQPDGVDLVEGCAKPVYQQTGQPLGCQAICLDTGVPAVWELQSVDDQSNYNCKMHGPKQSFAPCWVSAALH